MKDKIIRGIFWGTIGFIALSLGIVGFIYNKLELGKYESELITISNLFNNNKTIANYNTSTSIIRSHSNKREIIVDVNSYSNKEYTFNLERSYLETRMDKNDVLGKLIVMVITDSISIYKGGVQGDVDRLFSSDYLYSYKLKDGIEYIEDKGSYIIRINLDNALFIPDDLITEEDEVNEENVSDIDNNIENENATD